MSLQSEYFDPDTGIIHLVQQERIGIATGATDDMKLGLEDTSFNDVKVKLLSVKYVAQLFTAEAGDPTGKFFSTAFGDNGTVMFGIGNKNEVFSTYTSLGSFQGTSSFPIQIQGYTTIIGNPTSVTKTWTPRKMGLSNEQVAFITVRSQAVTSGCVAGLSIYMRLLRL